MKKHFELLEAIRSNYKLRDKESGTLEKAISACNEQIAIAPEVAQLFHQEFKELSQFTVEQSEQPLPETAAPLPVHTGYTQLAIIREKQGRLAEAICLCREAHKQGWAGDWESRIARYQKHQQKQSQNQ